MAIRVVQASDARQFRETARLHAGSITGGFLSTLGIGFLTALYSGIGRSRKSGVLVATDDGEILGFVSYTSDVRTCYKDTIRREWARLILAVVPNLLKPSFIRKALETLRYPLQMRDESMPDSRTESPAVRPELLSMAVSDKARGKGIGKLLVAALDQEMRRHGVKWYVLVTDAADPRSNSFYKKCGFNVTRQFPSHGKPMNEYRKDLQETENAG